MKMGNFRGGFGGGFGGANLGQLMKQAQKMQADMERAKDELNNTEFSSVVGGGMVKVVMMGNRTMKSIEIKPEIIDPDDKEMLEDLILAGVNDVLQQIAQKETENMPSMPGMPI